MQLETTRHDGLMVVSVLEDRLDAAIALDFKESMRELTLDGPERVILDMDRVRFLDSSGLGAVIGAMKQVGTKRKLELAGLKPAVAKVFRLTRMDSIFTIHATLDAALIGIPEGPSGTAVDQAHAY